MKLLFKHLMHSIRKRPTQPLIITLTLALSVALTVFALTVYSSLTTDAALAQEANYGSADFTVELGNSSDSRFLFASDVRDALGEGASVAGIYPLPMILDGTADTVSGVATELSAVGDLFSLEFTKYGRVTESTLTEVAFVSSAFADKRGLSVGDEILVTVMGREKSYRIEGVSDRLFMERYDVMVDVGSVMRAFADQSLLFAAIGEGFKPCSTVYVDLLDESADLGEVLDRLKADPRFEDKRFTDVRAAENAEEYMSYLETFIGVIVAFTMLLAGVVSFCCFYILANQRQEENFSLSCCGASPSVLGFMQYAEIIVYFLIGAPLGVLISLPTVRTISVFVGLSYAEVVVRPGIAVLSALLLLAVCILTVSLFLAFSKRAARTGERRHRVGLGRVLLPIGIMLLFLGLLFVVPSRMSFAVYCVQMAAMVVFLFLATSPLLQRLALFIDRIMRRSRSERAVSFRYAVKNVSSLKMMHNISMLCALATVIAFTVGFLLISFVAKATAFPTILQADFVVMNATDRCYEKIKECDGAESVNKFYMAATDGFIVMSSQDECVYSLSLDISEQPTGNGAVIGEGISRKYGLEVGDNMDIELDGVQYSFEVTRVAQTGFGIVVINCEDVGIAYNSILVEGGDGVSDSELLATLSEATATELAPIQAAETLFEKVSDVMTRYIRAAVVLVCVLSVFFLIGTLDALYECLRARGEDYRLYRLAGTGKGNLALMRAAEILIPIAFGILLGVLVAMISVPSVNRSLAGFGVVPFLDIKALRI